MLKWFHHLLNPHCRDCQEEAMSNAVCESCETVKMQLAVVNAEKRQLLEHIMLLTKPAESQASPAQTELKPVNKGPMLWNVRRQMLEAEDKKKFEIIAEQRKADAEAKRAKVAAASQTAPADMKTPIEDRAQSIEQLEKELGIEQEVKANA